MAKWQNTPHLCFLSAEKRSGNTLALEITALLTPNAKHIANATVSYVFRLIEYGRKNGGLPTFLYDEVDTVFNGKLKENTEDLRALLNESYRKKGTVGRSVCKGSDWVPEEFSVYCATALSGIGDLPDTILDRSICIRMRRRKVSETVEEWREDLHEPQAEELRSALAIWAAEASDALGWPDMPEGIEDRDRQIWRPLISVADAVEGDWADRARSTLTTLTTGGWGVKLSLSEQLLLDIQAAFEADGTEKILTRRLIDRLTQKPESTWNYPQYPLDDRSLAKRLSKYGIGPDPSPLEANGEKGRGYRKRDFIDAFERYLGGSNSMSNNINNIYISTCASIGDGLSISTRSSKEEPVGTPTRVHPSVESVETVEAEAPARVHTSVETVESVEAELRADPSGLVPSMPRELTILDMQRLRIHC
jgi:Protein of unknown function (DUF3631)